MAKSKTKQRWLIQVSVPWTQEHKDDPSFARKKARAPRYCRQAAEVFAIAALKECGKEAKARILCPETGEYIAYILDPNSTDIRRFQGRES